MTVPVHCDGYDGWFDKCPAAATPAPGWFLPPETQFVVINVGAIALVVIVLLFTALFMSALIGSLES